MGRGESSFVSDRWDGLHGIHHSFLFSYIHAIYCASSFIGDDLYFIQLIIFVVNQLLPSSIKTNRPNASL